ncbi:MAG: hypothetical protein O3B73_07585 [bacterium]|nr:hypothetical protein [bacterium]
MNIYLGFMISLVSGLYTSLWGAFKDSPFEDFKPHTFPRSIYFHAVIFAALFAIPLFHDAFVELKFFQLFFLVMGLERFLAELYKGFFRTEDQTKYFVPSRITFFGKYVGSDFLRYLVGTVLVLAVFAVATLPFPITSFWAFLAVGYGTGLLVSLGGAYKDAPFEGFHPLKFQRSGAVLAVCVPLFYFINDPLQPISLGFLVYMNGGLERFVVEYYKTYVQRTMSGKFKQDLVRLQHRVESREKFHYAAWGIIAGLVALYTMEL